VKPRTGYYKEITVERRGKEPLRGEMWIEDQWVVVVEAEDGRHKSMGVDHHLSSESLAKQMLVELEQERKQSDGNSD
jgi:hypothetical protein